MANHITKIIEGLDEWWSPQTLSIAENVFTRFIAGESIRAIQSDFDLNNAEVESAIRFFALKWKGNRSAVELYNKWQERRFTD